MSIRENVFRIVCNLDAIERRKNTAQWELDQEYLALARENPTVVKYQEAEKVLRDDVTSDILGALSARDRATWDGMKSADRKAGAFANARLETAWSRLNTLRSQGSRSGKVALASILHPGFLNTEVAEYQSVNVKGEHEGIASSTVATIAGYVVDEWKDNGSPKKGDILTKLFDGQANGIAAKPGAKTDADRVREHMAAVIALVEKDKTLLRVATDAFTPLLQKGAKQDNGTTPMKRQRKSRKPVTA
jgi:hypothetical protein